MKKVFVFALVFAMLFSLAACAGDKTGNGTTAEKASGAETTAQPETAAPETTAQPPEGSDPEVGDDTVVNPIQDVDSADAFASIGVTLAPPANAQDVRYSIIVGSIAQIDFTADGAEYTLRASKTEKDIAGLYGELKETKELAGGAILTELGDGDDTYRKIEWTADGMNVVLSNTDGASEEAVIGVYESLK